MSDAPRDDPGQRARPPPAPGRVAQPRRGQPTRTRTTVHDSIESIVTRTDMIEEELQQAELPDLAIATSAELVMLVEKLRSATAESIRIIRSLLGVVTGQADSND
jgi:hypothetical protein